MRQVLLIIFILCSCLSAVAQNAIPTSVDTKLVFDAAGPEQRKSLGNTYLIACPLGGGLFEIGAGFAIDLGVVVTNVHVTATCNETNLFGLSSANERITFSKVEKDQKRDLALLVPTKKPMGGPQTRDRRNTCSWDNGIDLGLSILL
jgi:S1-C subfamily serine protease